jgi:hypothetical protein
VTTYRDDFNGTVGKHLPDYDANWVQVRNNGQSTIPIGPATGSANAIDNTNTSAIYEYRGLSITAGDSECSLRYMTNGWVTVELQLILRSQGSGGGDHYRGMLTGQNQLKIERRQSGGVTDLTGVTASMTFDLYDVITFRAVGSRLSMLVNGVEKVAVNEH